MAGTRIQDVWNGVGGLGVLINRQVVRCCFYWIVVYRFLQHCRLRAHSVF